MPRLRMIVATTVSLALCAHAYGRELVFNVVDAGSGQAVSNVRVKGRSSRLQPFFPYILPMCSYLVVHERPEAKTDSSGIVSFGNVDGDESFRFEAEGYIPAEVNKGWFQYKISEYPYEKSIGLKMADGAILVPLRQQKHN